MRRHPGAGQQQRRMRHDRDRRRRSAAAAGTPARRTRACRPPKGRASRSRRRSAPAPPTRGGAPRAARDGAGRSPPRPRCATAPRAWTACAGFRSSAAFNAPAARRGRGTDRGSRGCNARTPGVSRIASVRGRGRSMSMTRSIRPGRGVITITWSDRNTASGTLWVMNSTVMRRSLQMRCRSSTSWSRVERVERAERLVHQELGRIVDQRPADRDALAHAAGQLVRILVLEAGEPDRGEQRARAPLGGRALELLRLRLQHDVAERGAPFEQHRALEHDADVGARRQSTAAPSIATTAARRRHQARRDHQQRALAAAARPDDRDELAASRR